MKSTNMEHLGYEDEIYTVRRGFASTEFEQLQDFSLMKIREKSVPEEVYIFVRLHLQCLPQDTGVHLFLPSRGIGQTLQMNQMDLCVGHVP